VAYNHDDRHDHYRYNHNRDYDNNDNDNIASLICSSTSVLKWEGSSEPSPYLLSKSRHVGMVLRLSYEYHEQCVHNVGSDVAETIRMSFYRTGRTKPCSQLIP
jgi:hypothetical protein